MIFISPVSAQDSGDAVSADEAVEETTGVVDETSLMFTEDTDAIDSPDSDSSSVWTYVSVVFVLALIVGAIYLLFYFLKKASAVSFSEDNEIRIVSSKAVTNNSRLLIIEIGNEFSLIGSGEHGITHIKDITDPGTIDRLRLASVERPLKKTGRFSEIFSSLFSSQNKNSDNTNKNSKKSNIDTETSKTFLKRQQDRLKKL